MPKTRLVLAALLLAAAGWTAAAPAQADEGKKASVTINNKSKYDIHHFYLSPTGTDEWGPDQLGEHTLTAGGSFKLNEIPCDHYDVKLVDHDGDECEVRGVDICGGSEQWSISNDDLLHCEGFK